MTGSIPGELHRDRRENRAPSFLFCFLSGLCARLSCFRSPPCACEGLMLWLLRPALNLAQIIVACPLPSALCPLPLTSFFGLGRWPGPRFYGVTVQEFPKTSKLVYCNRAVVALASRPATLRWGIVGVVLLLTRFIRKRNLGTPTEWADWTDWSAPFVALAGGCAPPKCGPHGHCGEGGCNRQRMTSSSSLRLFSPTLQRPCSAARARGPAIAGGSSTRQHFPIQRLAQQTTRCCCCCFYCCCCHLGIYLSNLIPLELFK